MVVGIDTALSGLAAIFAYLAWVRMTTRSRRDVESELKEQYEGGKVLLGKYEGARSGRLVVTPPKGFVEHARINLLPFGNAAGNTKIYVEYPDPKETTIIAHKAYPEYGIENVSSEGDRILSIEFSTTDPEEIESRLQQLPEILEEVIDTLPPERGKETA